MSDKARPLRVFLCHSSGDKPIVRELYRRLSKEGWIDPWLDEEKLYPGHDWDLEIEKAVELADVVIVCLSKGSVTKEGYVQRELRFALDIALTKPDETIFIIPMRLEDCQPPRRLRTYQYVDYFPKDQIERNYERMLVSLEMRAESLGLKWRKEPAPIYQEEAASGTMEAVIEPVAMGAEKSKIPADVNLITLGGLEFVRIGAGKFVMGSKDDNEQAANDEKPQHTVDIRYDYWIARAPITNEQYAQYSAEQSHPGKDWQKKNDHPVVNVSWDDAMAYCAWFNQMFKRDLGDLILRLPTEAEWEKAARGPYGNEWPWGNDFDKNKCNSREGGKGDTTPVGLYSSVSGDSPYGCADMSGNVWEWTHSLFKKYPYDPKDGRENEVSRGARVLRGGSFYYNSAKVRCAYRINLNLDNRYYNFGFRVCISPMNW